MEKYLQSPRTSQCMQWLCMSVIIISIFMIIDHDQQYLNHHYITKVMTKNPQDHPKLQNVCPGQVWCLKGLLPPQTKHWPRWLAVTLASSSSSSSSSSPSSSPKQWWWWSSSPKGWWWWSLSKVYFGTTNKYWPWWLAVMTSLREHPRSWSLIIIIIIIIIIRIYHRHHNHDLTNKQNTTHDDSQWYLA